jgi:hypothetical protein
MWPSTIANEASPPKFSHYHSVYARMDCWAESGVLDRVFDKFQTEQIVRIKNEVFTRLPSIKDHTGELAR